MNYEQVKHYIKQFFLTLTEEERKILVLLFSLFEKNYVIQQVFGKEELCFSIFPENHSAKAIFPISFSKKKYGFNRKNRDDYFDDENGRFTIYFINFFDD